jgi:hypothetical protein
VWRCVWSGNVTELSNELASVLALADGLVHRASGNQLNLRRHPDVVIPAKRSPCGARAGTPLSLNQLRLLLPKRDSKSLTSLRFVSRLE